VRIIYTGNQCLLKNLYHVQLNQIIVCKLNYINNVVKPLTVPECNGYISSEKEFYKLGDYMKVSAFIVREKTCIHQIKEKQNLT